MTNMIGAMNALSVLLSGVAARSADGRNFAHHPLLFLCSYFSSKLTSGLAFVDFGRPAIIRRKLPGYTRLLNYMWGTHPIMYDEPRRPFSSSGFPSIDDS